jgi:hypothetical protein|tara:strand:- start:600 stop:761 length:162 start_codon:yes stop_codon:yes gene_type:complete
MKFIYKDNLKKGKIVFACNAKSISEADKLYEKETGQKAMKQPFIGCVIEKDSE